MTIRINLGRFALGAMLAACAIEAAHATPAAKGVVVSYADLDITSKAGQQILAKRIDAAADTACGGAPAPMKLAERRLYDDCRSASVERALEQVKTAIAAGRTFASR